MPLPKPPRHLARLAAVAALLASAMPESGTAQRATGRLGSSQLATVPLARPGGEADARDRLAQLTAAATLGGYAQRTLATRATAALGDSLGFAIIAPELFYSHNSGHPWGWNDGALRAGVGSNIRLAGGVIARRGRVSVMLAPQVVAEENGFVPVYPYNDNQLPRRSPWAHPFHGPPESIDLPLRYGSDPRAAIDAEFRVAVDLGAQWRTGVSREHRWWGPSVRNPLLLGAQAPPFTQVFVESREPWRTGIGEFDATLLLGALREGEFFDFARRNNTRQLSAAALTWRPTAGARSLLPEIGVSRAVMRARAPRLTGVFDFLADVGRPMSDSTDIAKGMDQISTLWMRWVIPESRLDAWMEFARYEQPINLRDLLVNPGHTIGYTVGFAWAPEFRGGTLLLQSEMSFAEPSPSIRVRPVGSSYTSPSVLQGWTHEGQMLGPGMGPAGSTQWGTLDWRGPQWRMGVDLGRIRRDNNVLFTGVLPYPSRPDTQLWATLRLGRRIGPVDVLLEYTDAARLYYLWRAYDLPLEEGGWAGVDIPNRTFALTISP